jgi:mono/diheme cytochrome c family protein
MLKTKNVMHLKRSIVRYSFTLLMVSIIYFSFTSGAFAQSLPESDEAIASGRKLYSQNCTVCHAINNVVVGPALKDVQDRRPLPWLISFIRNSQRVIQSGDEYAVKLYEQYNKTEMPSFDFSDDEILNILAYIKQESSVQPQAVADAGGASVVGAGDGGSSIPSAYFTWIVVGFIVVLVLILFVLVLIVTILTKFINKDETLDEDTKEYIEAKFDFGKLVRSTSFLGFIVFLSIVFVAKNGIDALFIIGVQQGYAPTQPIAFSHALHAGQYEIDCNYCHTSVYESRSANIPSANICMNCHSAIKTESPEIKKIYAAIEKNKPIEWVRVHNLPDLAYFNHAQHTNVAGIDCQTCHGPIEEMEVVKQWSSLTMGWCIDCHRETAVNSKDNEYYDKLVELHDGKAFKVADIGGLECAKCHY